MNNQNLIIHDFLLIYEILTEIEDNLKFKISHIKKEELPSFEMKKEDKYFF